MKKLFVLLLCVSSSWLPLAMAQPQVVDGKVRELILEDARKQGLNQSPEFIATTREAQELILMRIWERSVLASQPVTAEMKAQMYKELEAFLGNSEYRIFQIFLDNEESARALIKAMTSSLEWERLNIRSIVTADTKFSVNKSDWVNVSSVLPEFRPVVRSLKPGQVTAQPIRVQAGWHVVGLLETRPLKLQTAEQMDKELTGLAERKIIADKLQILLPK